jgi:putative PEP-CTERM system histidine kinase
MEQNMFGVAIISHFIGAIVFSLSTVILIRHQSTREQANGLIIGCFFTSVWSALSALYASGLLYHYPLVAVSEIIRNVSWGFCALQLINVTQIKKHNTNKIHLGIKIFICILACILVYTALSIKSQWQPGISGIYAKYTFVGNIIFSICILSLIEQLYRGNVPERRWGLKFFCIGLGGLYAYDFYLYANGVLFHGISRALWEVRGASTAIVGPLMMISALRHRKWNSNLTPSRTLVLHSTVFIICGIYLVLMGAAGFYIRQMGGTWGGALQALFFFGAFVVLGGLLVSGKARSAVSLYLAKHLFKFRYDYRYEWERLTKLLTKKNDYLSTEQRMIKAVAELVQSPKGVLYQLQENKIRYTTSWNVSKNKCIENISAQLNDFFVKNSSPLLIQELKDTNELIYKEISVIPNAWLILPLSNSGALSGYIILCEPRVDFNINWEVKDFLSLASLQISVTLQQANDAKALVVAQKFEEINQMSAFIVHDIKNVISQLNFILSDKKTHQHNPEFIESVFRTVESSSNRLQKLITQVKEKQSDDCIDKKTVFVLQDALTEVLKMTQGNEPRLIIEDYASCDKLNLYGSSEQFIHVLSHLVTNAQQATPDNGNVMLEISVKDTNLSMVLTDNGEGMESDFIQEGLFKPFVSTKGEHGLGLGVFQAKQLIEKMGGSITVSSKKGMGTSFIVSLPLYALTNMHATQ